MDQQPTITLTRDEFDARLTAVLNNGFPIDRWFPDMGEAREIAEDPVKNLDFMLWVTESNENLLLSAEQEQAMAFLQEVLKNTVRFSD